MSVGSPVLVRKQFALDADEIAEVEQIENLHRLGADFFRMNVNLNAPGRVAQIDEMAFAHVAMRGDASGRAQGFAFLKFFADLARSCRWSQSGAEGRDAARAQLFQLGAPVRDEIVFVVHCKKATVNRKY